MVPNSKAALGRPSLAGVEISTSGSICGIAVAGVTHAKVQTIALVLPASPAQPLQSPWPATAISDAVAIFTAMSFA